LLFLFLEEKFLEGLLKKFDAGNALADP